MCNLYSATTNKEALRALARAMGEWLDETGNFQPVAVSKLWEPQDPVLLHVPGANARGTAKEAPPKWA